MKDPALELIETKIAYLERANSELSDVVFRQQREIQALTEALRAQLKSIEERFRSVPADERPNLLEERPPHY
jgi:uncharacterized coiled-coil protein SlyX